MLAACGTLCQAQSRQAIIELEFVQLVSGIFLWKCNMQPALTFFGGGEGPPLVASPPWKLSAEVLWVEPPWAADSVLAGGLTDRSRWSLSARMWQRRSAGLHCFDKLRPALLS